MTAELTFTSKIPVELMQCTATDELVVQAARTSTQGIDALPDGKAEGLINFLMEGRHGTPFEHNLFTFRVTAPILVWREHHRHRIGFSYNEESGRYKQLDPNFYIPAEDRNLVQTGKPGHYIFVPGDADQYKTLISNMRWANQEAYEVYEVALEANVAREVARMVLPVNIFSTCFVTCNARSLMAFLSLRTKDENSTFPSFPQREIEIVAEQYEKFFAEAMPITYAAFVANGRVAP
jgi:thymidylate synthase (FAD)